MGADIEECRGPLLVSDVDFDMFLAVLNHVLRLLELSIETCFDEWRLSVSVLFVDASHRV